MFCERARKNDEAPLDRDPIKFSDWPNCVKARRRAEQYGVRRYLGLQYGCGRHAGRFLV